MTNSFVACALALTVTAAVPALVFSQGQKDSDAVAAITKLENDAIKAVLANDSSFYEKVLANDYTGGTSRGTWDTKPSILADMKDVKNNKTKSQDLTDLKVRVHGDLAIATYRSTYDAVISGKQYTQNCPVHGRAPTAERRLEADGEPLLSSRQIGCSEPPARGCRGDGAVAALYVLAGSAAAQGRLQQRFAPSAPCSGAATLATPSQQRRPRSHHAVFYKPTRRTSFGAPDLHRLFDRSLATHVIGHRRVLSRYLLWGSFPLSLSSALVGGVGRDAEHIVDHIDSTRKTGRADTELAVDSLRPKP